MGILCILASALLGFGGVVIIMSAQGVPQQLFGGELLICACVLFAAGAVCNSVDKAKPQPPKADISHLTG